MGRGWEDTVPAAWTLPSPGLTNTTHASAHASASVGRDRRQAQGLPRTEGPESCFFLGVLKTPGLRSVVSGPPDAW